MQTPSLIKTHIICDSILASAQEKLWRAFTFSSGTQIYQWRIEKNLCLKALIPKMTLVMLQEIWSKVQTLKWGEPVPVPLSQDVTLHATASPLPPSLLLIAWNVQSSGFHPTFVILSVYSSWALKISKTELKEIKESKTLRLALHLIKFQDQHLLLWLQATNPGAVWNSGHGSISQYHQNIIYEYIRIYLNVYMCILSRLSS